MLKLFILIGRSEFKIQNFTTPNLRLLGSSLFLQYVLAKLQKFTENFSSNTTDTYTTL